MAVYEIYKRHKEELVQACKDYSDTLDEQRELFQMTQPSSVQTDREAGGGKRGSGTDRVDRYLIEAEKRSLPERLKSSREIIAGMKERLADDEDLLRMSGELYDRVYYMRFLEHRSVPDIASRIHASQSYVFRIIKEIK